MQNLTEVKKKDIEFVEVLSDDKKCYQLAGFVSCYRNNESEQEPEWEVISVIDNIIYLNEDVCKEQNITFAKSFTEKLSVEGYIGFKDYEIFVTALNFVE